MEIKDTRQIPDSRLPKLESVKMELATVQAFEKLIQDIGAHPGLEQDANSMQPVNTVPPPAVETGNAAASNFWNAMKLAVKDNDEDEETGDPETNEQRRKERPKRAPGKQRYPKRWK